MLDISQLKSEESGEGLCNGSAPNKLDAMHPSLVIDTRCEMVIACPAYDRQRHHEEMEQRQSQRASLRSGSRSPNWEMRVVLP